MCGQFKMQQKSFSEKCYILLRKVPKGKITTYKALANALGTKAYRAVGSAMNKNPYSPADGGDVCCHRVINSNGEVGGFASGSENKIKMLKKEGIPIKDNRVQDADKYWFKF